LTSATGPWRHDAPVARRSRAVIAAILGAAGLFGVVFVSTKIGSLTDRPGAALMASLILVIVVTLIGGAWVGYAVVVASLFASAFFLARPLHSFTVDTVGVRILFVGFLVTGLAISALVARLALTSEGAERARRRTDRLQQLTASLSRARTAAAVYEVVLMEGREALGANAGLVATPADDGASIELAATLGFTAAEQEGWQRFPAAMRTPIGDALRDGQAVFLDEGELARRYPDVRTSTIADGIRAAAGRRARARRPRLPLRRGPSLTEAERALASSLAEHCAHALERARLYDAERRSRQALGILASIGEHLARSLDSEAALRTLAELAVPAIRRPVRRRSRARRPDRAPRAGARGPRDAGGCTHARAVRA